MRARLLALSLFCLFAVPGRAAQSPQKPPAAPPQTAAPAAVPIVEKLRTPPAKKYTGYSLSPELYKKAKTLARIRFSFRIFSFAFSLFTLWLILRAKWSANFRDWAERITDNRTLQALIYAPLLAITFSFLQLPLDLFDESLRKHYGISVQPWGSWTGDWFKSLLLTLIIGAILARILLAVVRRSQKSWWFHFWIISNVIFLFIFFIQPLAIDPMFNQYAPLSTKAPQLIPQLERITIRGGMPIPPERMFWMLASDKTIYTNASVNGFGATKRVVVWDTSIAKETTDGILLMFGHEMGHYALNHIPKGLAFASLLSLVLLYTTYRAIGPLLSRNAANWHVRGLDDWAALPAILFVVTLFGFIASVIGNNLSRYQENQADIYSLEVTRGLVLDPGQACAASYQMYGEQVFVEPDPNLVNVILFYDHPPVAHRVNLCLTYDPWSNGQSPQFVK